MKVPFTLGTVGHFGLAVRDPSKTKGSGVFVGSPRPRATDDDVADVLIFRL